MLKYLNKRQRTDEGAGHAPENPHAGPLPRTFLSLNVNGLKTRVAQEDGAWLRGIGALVERLEPDVIAMQEAKLTAKAPPGAKRGDDKKRERDQPFDNDKQKDWLTVKQQMLSKEPWCRYTPKFSCADWRYAGTLTLFKKGLRAPEKFYFNLELEPGTHDVNGRVCIAEYSTGLRVVNLYAPNNGWNEKSNFASRRSWDAKLLAFVRRCYDEKKPLVIVGDLNVAHQEQDVSHPEWFRSQTGERAGKSWTQQPKGEDIEADDKGQPGFTRNEQTRFTEVLCEGHLIDTWRKLHPQGEGVEIGDPNWTWRGSGHETDKYHKRGMRIDYALVSDSLRQHVLESYIIGRGVDRCEGFFGSDHSPIFLMLSPLDSELPAAAGRPPAPAAAARVRGEAGGESGVLGGDGDGGVADGSGKSGESGEGEEGQQGVGEAGCGSGGEEKGGGEQRGSGLGEAGGAGREEACIDLTSDADLTSEDHQGWLEGLELRV